MRHTVYLDNFEDINAHMTMQQVRLPSSLQTPALPLVWPFAPPSSDGTTTPLSGPSASVSWPSPPLSSDGTADGSDSGDGASPREPLNLVRAFQAGAAAGPDEEKTDAKDLGGSAGHPFTCAQPCKFVGTRRGCKDGDRCARCHQCPWRRARQHEIAKG